MLPFNRELLTPPLLDSEDIIIMLLLLLFERLFDALIIDGALPFDMLLDIFIDDDGKL